MNRPLRTAQTSSSASGAQPARTAPRTWPWLAAGLVLLAAAFVLLWGLNMRRGLNHDEHQFVASGALLARAGLLPYRDFA